MWVDEEMLSWLSHCPVCGVELDYDMVKKVKNCPELHGDFKIEDDQIIFVLDPEAE